VPGASRPAFNFLALDVTHSSWSAHVKAQNHHQARGSDDFELREDQARIIAKRRPIGLSNPFQFIRLHETNSAFLRIQPWASSQASYATPKRPLSLSPFPQVLNGTHN
jgi:hypothetical protein